VPASTRFIFNVIVRRSGQPAFQYLVSDGPSFAYGSVGQIIWDGVYDRFCWLQTNIQTKIVAAADFNCLVNFAASLARISPIQIQL
jgi:hypothetical protein